MHTHAHTYTLRHTRVAQWMSVMHTSPFFSPVELLSYACHPHWLYFTWSKDTGFFGQGTRMPLCPCCQMTVPIYNAVDFLWKSDQPWKNILPRTVNCAVPWLKCSWKSQCSPESDSGSPQGSWEAWRLGPRAQNLCPGHSTKKEGGGQRCARVNCTCVGRPAACAWPWGGARRTVWCAAGVDGAHGGCASVCAFGAPWGLCSAGRGFLCHPSASRGWESAQARVGFTLCSGCPLIWIASEQICVFKASYSRTPCTFSICFSSCLATYAAIQFANRSRVARRAFLSSYLTPRM